MSLVAGVWGLLNESAFLMAASWMFLPSFSWESGRGGAQWTQAVPQLPLVLDHKIVENL